MSFAAWTKNIFESQAAIEPAIGQEALKCVQLVLFQRNAIVGIGSSVSNNPVNRTKSKEDSQDSQDLFGDDDFDFDDPALNDVLGEGRQSASQAQRDSLQAEMKEKDKLLAAVLEEYISPSLSQLISNLFHPDRVNSKSLESRTSLVHQTMEKEELESLSLAGPFRVELQTRMNELLKASSLRKYVELVVDCWVGSNNVLVKNGLKSWSAYLNQFGPESYKKFEDLNVRRNLGLRLCQNILLLSPDYYQEDKNEFITIWFSTIGDKALSIQNLFTNTLIKVSKTNSDLGVHPFMRGLEEELTENGDTSNVRMEQNQSQILSLPRLSDVRINLLRICFQNMKSINDSPDPNDARQRALIYSCFSALLSTLRQCLNDASSTSLHPAGEDSPSAKARKRIDMEYLEFCSSVEKAARESLGEKILKGAGPELEVLGALVKRRREEMGSRPQD